MTLVYSIILDMTLLYLIMLSIILFLVYFDYMLDIVRSDLYSSIGSYSACSLISWVSGKHCVGVVPIPYDEVMTMLGELHGGRGDQQGHLNREGGLKLIRFESSRWRPKSSFSPPRNPRPVCLELVTQDAYGLCFR
jgi:hypothetical protein